MPRLHTLYLPNGRRSTPFAFILDQTNPMTEAAITAWQAFAEKCGALDIMFTAETIDIDPEISDGWEPDDEPVGYTPSDSHHCGDDCMPKVIGLPDLLSMVQAAHAAAWVPWEPANLDPESPRISTHREEVCPALNNGAEGCPMHAPILHGDWAGWPYYASHNPETGTTITRICDHGVTHPTPEEYLGGLDIPHLCDGCECAPEEDRNRYTIVVSDLANTRLPRGTLLLGVKDDPAPVTAPPVTAAAEVTPEEWFSAPITHTATAETLANAPLSGDWARVQPLGADGEPVGEAGVYDLAGPVRVTEIPTEQGEPVENEKWATAEIKLTTFNPCGAGSLGAPCALPLGHEGLHEFVPFTRV